MVNRDKLLGELVQGMEVKLHKPRIGRRPKAKMPIMRIESLSTGKVTVIENKPKVVEDLEAWLDKPVLPK